MKLIIFIIVLGAMSVTAQYYGDTARIGGYTGTRITESSSEKNAVINESLNSVDNPERKQISLELFKKNCLNDVKHMYAINQNGELVQTERYQRYNGSIKLRPISDKTRYRVVQMLPDNMAIITAASGYSNPYIGTKLPGTVPDGTKFDATLINLNKTYTYTTVLGASKTIALAAIEPDPEPATEEIIIEAFKKGQAFDILYTKEYKYKCSTCRGTGTVIKQKGTFSLRGRCDACNGKKQYEISLPTVFTVSVK